MHNVMTEAERHQLKEKILGSEIYIVDDEPIVANTLAHYLYSADFKHIHVFTDSISAIESFKTCRPDVILTDLQMPDMDGNHLIRVIRSFPRLWATPIIVVTAEDLGDVQQLAIRYGADTVLEKPVKRSKLSSSIVTAINRSREKTQQHNRRRWN